jgi:hypothetical protein
MTNGLVEAKFKIIGSGNLVKLYRHSKGKTGVYMAPHQPRIYNVDVEAFYYQFQKQKGYELIETTRQIKEREFGNADEAYEVTKFENGKVVGVEA